MDSSLHFHKSMRMMDVFSSADKSMGLVYTPFQLAIEMLDQIPLEVWYNPGSKFLDPACDRGTFMLLVKELLLQVGHSERHIVENMLYMWDTDRRHVLISEKVVNPGSKYRSNVIHGNILEWETDMKFDVVIGNPPYQNSSHNSTTNSLWKEFVAMAPSLSSGIISFVLPDIAIAPPTFSKIKRYVSYVSIDIKKYFPKVGSGFCQIMMHREEQKITKVKTPTDIFKIDTGQLDYIPLVLDAKLLEEISLYLTGEREWHLTYEYESRKPIYSDNGKYEVLHTPSNPIKRTNVFHSNNNLIRVSVSASGYPKFTVVHNKGLSQSHYWTVFSNIEDAENYAKWGNSVSVQSFLKKMKWGGMNSALVIKNLK